MKPTFNQLVSGTFALLCLVALCAMYFFPSKVNPEVAGGIVVAFVVAFKDFANAFVKEHSATQPLIDAFAKSSPINQAAPQVNTVVQPENVTITDKPVTTA
jgi:hypothetical protein